MALKASTHLVTAQCTNTPVWRVVSLSGGIYTVRGSLNSLNLYCDCPSGLSGNRCSHVLAVEFDQAKNVLRSSA